MTILWLFVSTLWLVENVWNWCNWSESVEKKKIFLYNKLNVTTVKIYSLQTILIRRFHIFLRYFCHWRVNMCGVSSHSFYYSLKTALKRWVYGTVWYCRHIIFFVITSVFYILHELASTGGWCAFDTCLALRFPLHSSKTPEVLKSTESTSKPRQLPVVKRLTNINALVSSFAA